jgi:hypothetical protein
MLISARKIGYKKNVKPKIGLTLIIGVYCLVVWKILSLVAATTIAKSQQVYSSQKKSKKMSNYQVESFAVSIFYCIFVRMKKEE